MDADFGQGIDFVGAPDAEEHAEVWCGLFGFNVDT